MELKPCPMCHSRHVAIRYEKWARVPNASDVFAKCKSCGHQSSKVLLLGTRHRFQAGIEASKNWNKECADMENTGNQKGTEETMKWHSCKDERPYYNLKKYWLAYTYGAKMLDGDSKSYLKKRVDKYVYVAGLEGHNRPIWMREVGGRILEALDKDCTPVAWTEIKTPDFPDELLPGEESEDEEDGDE